MGTYLTQISNYLLRQSWQIAILVVVVAIVSWLLRNRSAHVRYLLWLIVLAKCLVPPILSLPLAVLPEDKPFFLETSLPLERDIAVQTTPTNQIEPVTTKQDVPVPEKTVKFTKSQILISAWLTGVIIFLSVAILKAIKTNHWLKGSRRALPVNFQADIENSLTELKLKTLPRLWLLDGIGQPFVWGLLRGDIYLPTDFIKLKDNEHRKDILGHEISHVLRLDAAVNMLQVVAQAIFWFHPFVWWANKKIRAEREKCCDEMAIARMGATPKDYSKAIVNVLIYEHKSTRPVPSLAVAGPVKNIEERIKTMLRPGKKFYKRPSVVAATIAILLALITVPTALVLTARAEAKATTESNMLLYNAISKGDAEQVRSLILQGADVNAQEELEFTPLHLAALLGYEDVIKILIDEGANPNIKIADEVSPIYCAIVSPVADRMKVTELLIDKGAEFSKIHIAAFLGDIETVKDLINNGTDINSKDIMDTTPLHFAAAGGQKDIIEFLIDEGADINAGTAEEFTPLHTAVCFSGDPEVINLLIAKGADVKVKGLLVASLETAAVKAMISRLPEIDFTEFNPQQFGQIMTDEFTSKHDSESTKLLLSVGAKVDEDTLFMAAEMGIKHIIESAIAEGIDLNVKDHDGGTALWYAKEQGHTEIVELLQKHGAKEIAPDPGVLLHRAIERGDIEQVKSLIEKGADVNDKDDNDQTPLHIVAQRDHIEIAELLLSKGTNIEAKNKWGRTPLHIAADRGHKLVAELLIAKGADVNAKDDNGQTPLHLAAQGGHRDMVKLLVTMGADIYAKAEGQWGNTPLHSAASSGRKEIVELLIASGTDVDVRNRVGDTPLRCACYGDHVNVMGILLGKDANIEAEDRWGRTPLHIAAEHHSPDAVKLLLARGADVNAGIPSGNTPLHRAIMSGDTEIAGLLLAKGADLSARYQGYTPVALAMWKDQKEMVRFLMDKGAELSEVHVAAYFGDLDKVNRFLSDGGNVDARDPSGLTLIHSAICGGNRQIIESLLAKGANVNAQDSSGWAPLHMASAAGCEQITKSLLAGGANLGLCDKSGRTALHWAAMKNHKTIVEMLLAKGSNVNARTGSIIAEGEKDGGWTPLHQACAGGHKDVAEVLIDHGADIGVRTENGDTALSIAKKEYELKRMPIHKDVMEILRKHGAKE